MELPDILIRLDATHVTYERTVSVIWHRHSVVYMSPDSIHEAQKMFVITFLCDYSKTSPIESTATECAEERNLKIGSKKIKT
jgi:hypothetical protein